jgi:2-oxoglutarate dehydrogenase E2 component (dihydrolipoamide succinyltransferase)
MSQLWENQSAKEQSNQSKYVIQSSAEGVFAKADVPIAVIETDKINVDIKASISGLVLKHNFKAGDIVKVGVPFCVLDEAAKEGASAAPVKPAEQPAKPVEAAAPVPQTKPVEKAPVVEKPIEKKADTPAPVKPTPKPEAKPITTNIIKGQRIERRIPLSRLRMRVAERLKDSQNTCAMLTTFNECDMSELMKLKKDLQQPFLEKYNSKLGFMSAFIKASQMALAQYPVANAVINGNDIIFRDYCDISVAVSAPQGLVVPVIRNVETLSFSQIELKLAELAEKARKGKIDLEDMTGGTFTITNGGVFGSMLSTPIINPPQSAILGLHSIKNRPVCVGDKIVARPMMYLAVTYDHRLVDGRDAVLLLKSIKEMIEDPRRMLLDI